MHEGRAPAPRSVLNGAAVSLLVGLAILAFAVLLGGFAALFQEPGRKAMPAIRTFAVVAAAAIALLHLLPEAFAEIGLPAILATLVGALGPAAIERTVPSQRHHTHEAPTTALAMGYAAVVVHQVGEGAALASLAKTGALRVGIVLAIAAHTAPLSMVVAIRVLEVKREAGKGQKRAIVLALLGVALSTVVGAGTGSLVGTAQLSAVQPWLLGLVAGLLLHALSHDVMIPAGESRQARVFDMLAGWAGLLVATVGIEEGDWLEKVPSSIRIAGFVALAGVIALKSFWWRGTKPHDHAH